MPKMPIPSDWMGDDWEAWYICWPDSPEWRGILQGQISEPSLGYFWDGSTGVIIDAQAIGNDINTENLPLKGAFMRCGDEIDRLIAAIASQGTNGVAACGCAGGSTQATTSGTEGGVAPAGFVDPPDAPGSPEYATRKCKVANMSHENIRDMFIGWANNGIGDFIGQGILSAAAFILVTTIVSTVLGELSTPFPIIDALAGGIIGFIASIAIAIAVDNFDLNDLVGILEDNGQDFVCALFNSTSGQEAIDDYVQVADDWFATTAQKNVLRATLWVDYLNALFFSSETDPGLEAALTAYTPPFSCATCAPGETLILINGTSTDDLDVPGTITVDAVDLTSRFEINVAVGPVDVGPDHCHYFEWTLVSGAFVDTVFTDQDKWICGAGANESTATPPVVSSGADCLDDRWYGYLFRSDVAFSMQFIISETCP